MEESKKALIGIVISLLPLAAIVLGEFSGGLSDVAFLTAFLVYVSLFPWAVSEYDERLFLILVGSMALMAPAQYLLTGQPGIVTVEDSFHDLEFSTMNFLLLSASGILYYYALSKVSEKTGVRAFRTQGLFYLLASVGSVTVLGILGWIGWILGVPASHFLHYRAVRKS
ncbi:hypothetical protein [Thermococcus sp.]|uniref:hypothetical protein n=1 Tax=Thermococcus sp. TaxID=35749 RepID=UPI0025D6C57E|nr:hypothetical protein [Thermococcus sp.]